MRFVMIIFRARKYLKNVIFRTRKLFCSKNNNWQNYKLNETKIKRKLKKMIQKLNDNGKKLKKNDKKKDKK